MSTKTSKSSEADASKEEDLGVLIYKESQLRKKEAAIVAAKKRQRNTSASKRCRSSTRKAAPACKDTTIDVINARRLSSKRKRHLSGHEEQEVPTKVARKKYSKKRCSADGCANQSIKGGVCVKHGAKRKICNSEGCSNRAVKGGVCKKHGAKVKQCSSGRCTNIVQNGGVCFKHGAKHK
jgi:hypothetical protein